MQLNIIKEVVGPVMTNCYIAYTEAPGRCFIVDPGANAERIIKRLTKLELTPEAILLTHGHFDHICAVEKLRENYEGIKLIACSEERQMLEIPELNLTDRFKAPLSLKNVVYYQDGESFEVIGISIKMIHTPGHTSGSCCYFIDGCDNKVLFSGDTLFAESFGRTDLPTGSDSEIVVSIAKKLMELPDETDVYPGHESATTIGHERKYNPSVFIYGRHYS